MVDTSDFVGGIVFAIFFTFICTFSYINHAIAGEELSRQVELQIANPYRFSMEMEVQCDWNDTQKSYIFHKYFYFPSKQITTLKLPTNLHLCKLWPHINLLGGKE